MRTRAAVAVFAAPLSVLVLACGATSGSRSSGAGAGPQDPAVASNAAAAVAPTGPVTAFADGTYEVGAGAGQVPAGKYKTTAVDLCYWSRLKNLSGDNDIIANGVEQAGAPMVVTIAKTDAGFKTSGCGTWQRSA